MTQVHAPPRFSIITINYNNRAGLERTTRSVDSQSFSDWEHLIVDGGSSDGSVAWLKSLPADSRRSFNSAPDGGIYDAMNKGMERSSGEILMFLNSGDCLTESQTLDRIHTSQASIGWGWSYGGVRYTDTEGHIVGAYVFSPFKLRKFVMGISWIPHSTVSVTRALAQRTGAYRLDVGSIADQEYLMRLLQLSEPHEITWFLSDFERGGVSQEMGPRERELAWHRMRLATGNEWHNRFLDRLASEVLSVLRPARIWLRRFSGGSG